MFLIANLLRSMYSRKQNTIVGNIDNCIVTVPKVLKGICLIMSVIGLMIVLICLILKKKGINNIGIGHINFAIIFMLIGLIGSICAFNWKIVVHDEEISANAKTRDARKKVLDEIKASGKTPSGLRRRVDSSYALKHKELLKKYAQSSIVGNSKELLANQLEYETDIYVIKGHANIKGYIKDMLKDFLPIENSDDWIMSILSNNIKVDKDGEETLEICGVMG